MVFVAYLATFGRSTRLPAAVDPSYWVPVLPAVCEGGDRNVFEPLPDVNGIAQWVSVRKRIYLKEREVGTFHLSSLRLVRA